MKIQPQYDIIRKAPLEMTCVLNLKVATRSCHSERPNHTSQSVRVLLSNIFHAEHPSNRSIMVGAPQPQHPARRRLTPIPHQHSHSSDRQNALQSPPSAPAAHLLRAPCPLHSHMRFAPDTPAVADKQRDFANEHPPDRITDTSTGGSRRIGAADTGHESA